MRIVLLIIGLMISLASYLAFADYPVKVFQTNRPAEELVQVIRPIVGNDGSVTAFQDKLIVKASSQNLIEIARTLNEIDHAPRNLVIFVIYGDSAHSTVRGGGIHSSGVELNNSVSTQKNSSEQQIRVLEGEKAFISVAEERPQTTVQISAYGNITAQTSYQSAGNGFYVRPSINGDQVRLELSTQNDSFKSSDPNIIQRNQSNTVLVGKIGEPISVSGAGTNNSEDQSGINYSTRKKKYGQSGLTLRVEVDR